MDLLATSGDVWLGAGMTLANVVAGILVILGARHLLRNQAR
jgi:hypothetical protein